VIGVTDTSVVLNLCCLRRENLLPDLFGIESSADAVLIDERAGRAAAAALGLPHVGILGILIQSKETGQIPEVRPLLDQLQFRAGFWIAPPLRKKVLDFVDE
jgi:predicted nucleic acid-binding protein